MALVPVIGLGMPLKAGGYATGMRVSILDPIRHAHYWFLLARQCETLGDAIASVARVLRLHDTPSIVTLGSDGEFAYLAYDDMTPSVPQRPQICELALAIAAALIRIAGDLPVLKPAYVARWEPAIPPWRVPAVLQDSHCGIPVS